MVKITLFIHILAALFWIGGMLFLSLIVAPFLLTIEDRNERSRIYQVVGTRYRFWGWLSLAALLVTGPINLYLLWGVPPSDLVSHEVYGSAFGKALGAKLGLVFLIVLTSLLHDFWIGPGARTSPKFSAYARFLGRFNLAVALIIVMLAVMLRTGG